MPSLNRAALNTMNDREYALMREVEDSHWWYAVLHESVIAELKTRLNGHDDVRILDAGCGTGGMMNCLRQQGAAWRLTGLDISPSAIEHTRQRGFSDLTQGSVDALPFANASFDAVLSLDVLYFDGVDEMRAAAEFRRVLKPEGTLVLNLPAFNVLRGQHDVAVRGVRRYTPRRIRRMLAGTAFEILRSHCWNLWLFLPILCWRRLRKPRDAGAASSDLSLLPALLNKALTFLGRLDMSLCRAVHAPLGTSVLVVARKQRVLLQP